MAFTFGFYNALNHDRRYNAIQVSSIFDGIIKDGIFMSIGGHMNVKATGNGFNIVVESGRAWFNHTWSLLDADYPMVVSPSDVLEDRIDAVVLEVNENVDVRQNFIKIITGTPAEKPTKPALTNNLDIHQYALAYITVPANSVTLTQSNVENAIGLGSTPFVTGILETINIDDLVAQWKSQWNDWTEEVDLNWNNWFDTVDNAWTTWFTQQQSKWEDILNERTEEWEEIKDTVDSEWASQQGSINSDYTNWKSSALAAYNQWLDQIKGTLDDDAATQLAKEVVELKNRDDVISTYQHVKSGTEHMFIGSGSNGKVKMTADIASGDTVVISSAPKQKITVEGATSQPGSGDPSPKNIRMIDGVGMYDQCLVLDGSENEGWRVEAFAGYYRRYCATIPAPVRNNTRENQSQKSNYLVSNVSVQNQVNGKGFNVYNFRPSSSDDTNVWVFIGGGEFSDVNELKDYLSAHPLIIWYRSVDFYKCKGPFYYVHEVSDGTESPYKAIGIELNAPLFDGDSLEIGGLSGFDKMIIFDGSDAETWSIQATQNGVTNFAIDYCAIKLVPPSPTGKASAYSNRLKRSIRLFADAAAAKENKTFFMNAFNVFYRSTQFTGVAGLKADLKAHPLIIFYKSVNYTPEADIAVALESCKSFYKTFDGTEKFTLAYSGEEANEYDLVLSGAGTILITSSDDNASCSHFKKDNFIVDGNWQASSMYSDVTIQFFRSKTDCPNVDSFKQWLQEEYEKGTPVQCVMNYKTAVTYAHPIQTESLPAYYGTEDFVTALAGEPVTDKWLTFTNDGAQLNFKGGGGVGVSKLAATTAVPADVVQGKTFYSKDKTLKTGTLTEKSALTDAVSVGNDGSYLYARIPVGAYRTKQSTGYPEIRFPNSDAIENIPGGDNGAWNGTYSGSNVTIPQGYHNGSGSVGVAGGNRGNWSGTYSGSDVTIPQGYHAGGGKVGVAGGNRGNWSGTYSGSDVAIPQGYHAGGGKVGVSGGNKGAWGSTINPGGSVTIPQGYHNGQGRVRANDISVNYMAIDSDAYWNDNVQIYESENVSPGTSGQVRYTIQYWSTSEYNVSGYFQICRNGSEIESIPFEKNGGLPTEPSGFFDRTYSEPGTYSLRIRIDYHAGNGTMHIGGVIVGY